MKSDEWYNFKLADKNSVITDLFRGQVAKEIECLGCHEKKYIFSLFWDLILTPGPITSKKAKKLRRSKSIPLKALLQIFQRTKKENSSCQFCQNQKGKSHNFISKLPEALIISFEKFKYQEEEFVKARYSVKFPIELDLKDYTLNSKNGKAYQLIYLF